MSDGHHYDHTTWCVVVLCAPEGMTRWEQIDQSVGHTELSKHSKLNGGVRRQMKEIAYIDLSWCFSVNFLLYDNLTPNKVKHAWQLIHVIRMLSSEDVKHRN